jgi:hypothetical protein
LTPDVRNIIFANSGFLEIVKASFSGKLRGKKTLLGRGAFNNFVDADDGGAGWDVAGDDGVGADNGVSAYLDAAEDFGTGADEDVVFDDRGAIIDVASADGDLVEDYNAFAQNGLRVDDDAVGVGEDSGFGQLAVDVAVQEQGPKATEDRDLVAQQEEHEPGGGWIPGVTQHDGHELEVITAKRAGSK